MGPLLEQAGSSIIEEYCSGYDTSSSSYMLPPIFNSMDTEERGIKHQTASNEIPALLRSPNRKRRSGLPRSRSGETVEYKVFSLFDKLQRISLKKQFIFIHKFNLDNNNSHQIKETQIKNELPGIDLSKVNMRRELDGLVIVKGLGIVVFEVKTYAVQTAIKETMLQLDNGKRFAEALMGGIRGKRRAKIPCAKVIFAPGDQNPSPIGLTTNGCFQIHQDKLVDFQKVWDDIIHSLSTFSTSISSAEFARLTRICVGIWCLTPRKCGFIFDMQETSKSHVARKFDRRVYMTPEQKEIFDNYPRAIIHGGAGSGKTLLTLYKVIDIVQNDKENAKVLIIVPPPHDQRCKEILKRNDIESTVIQKFPKQSGALKAGVFIISLKNFFHVTPKELDWYDTINFHIFLDDVQSYRPPKQEHTIAKYSDILTFLGQIYASAKLGDKYLWCCVDVFQSSCHYEDDDSSSNLFYDKSGQVRPRGIPMVPLVKNIRNSCEVINLVTDIHIKNKEARVQGNWVNAEMLLGEMKPGHSITSFPVMYQKIQQGSPVHCQIPFVIQMLENEFAFIFGSASSMSLRPSDIAILHEDLDGDILKEAIDNFLQQNYNFKTQTIEQSITNNDKDTVVFDSYCNAMSYEVACVIFICQVSMTVPYYGPYVIASRARARLTFIDYDVTKPPFDFVADNVTLVTWQFNQGAFERFC